MTALSTVQLADVTLQWRLHDERNFTSCRPSSDFKLLQNNNLSTHSPPVKYSSSSFNDEQAETTVP